MKRSTQVKGEIQVTLLIAEAAEAMAVAVDYGSFQLAAACHHSSHTISGSARGCNKSL